MVGTFEIAGIDKDKFSTELARIRAKFKQVSIWQEPMHIKQNFHGSTFIMFGLNLVLGLAFLILTTTIVKPATLTQLCSD